MHEFNLFLWLSDRVGFLSWITPATIHIASAGFVAVVLLVMGVVFRLKLRDMGEAVVPHPKSSLVGVVDAASEQLLKLIESVVGEKGIKYLPLLGSLFLYIFCCNLLSVIPGFLPPTDNINTNIPCAVIVFVYYNAMGFKEHGFAGYLRHFAGPIIWLAPLMFSLEIVSHCVRPVALSVRLFGNITGDHMVLGIFSQLVPLVVPVVFMFLALFVAFIQAFVFALLSAVYIALATGHE